MLKYASHFSIIVSILVLMGWLADIDFLQNLGFEDASMKVNTAICFFLLGVTLLPGKGFHRLKLVAAFMVCLLAGLSVIENLFFVDLGIDQFLIKDEGSSRGLMSLGTALSFFSFGIVFFLFEMSTRWPKKVGQYVLNVISVIAFLAMLGFINNISSESNLAFISSMAVHTAFLLLLLSARACQLHPQYGFTGLLTGSRLGSQTARQLFLILVFIIVTFDVITNAMINSGFIGVSNGLNVFAIALLFACFSAISIIALQLNEVDKIRLKAEQNLKDTNANLENEVNERTSSLKKTLDLLYETNRVALVGGWEIDLANDNVDWTSVTKRIFEVPANYIPNFTEKMEFYKPGKSREAMSKAINDALSFGLHWDMELQIVSAKGNVKWIRTIGRPTFADGKCVKLNGTFQDIDLRKKAELRIEEEVNFLQTVLDNIPVNVYVKDLDSRKTLVNKEELKLIGFNDRSEVLGKSDFEIYPSESAEISRKEDLEVFTTGEPIIRKETSITMDDARTEHFLSSKIPIRNKEEEITGLLGVSVNITERKIAEEKLKTLAVLEAKSKEMDQFAYVASHDLREPLLTVKNYLKVLLEDFGADIDEEAKRYVSVIQNGVGRMEDMIQALLDYSRLGRVKELERINVSDILDQVIADLDFKISESKAQIVLNKKIFPVVKAYPVELKLAFQNLISNAIKFGREGFPVKITIDHTKVEGGWQFSVSDNGIGIPEKEFKNIFLIFRKLHRRDEFAGSGIGLAHCRKIVEYHNGDIWVESKQGIGSTFYFTILTE
ncbi:MAG: ATP-binding protein [Cyclobacteriaceae bacterium]